MKPWKKTDNVLTKKELILKIKTRQPDMTMNDIQSGVNVIIEVLIDSVSGGRRIEIRGFGAFYLKLRAPRTVRNPKTGETHYASARHQLLFRTGKTFAKLLNQNLSPN